MIFPELLRGILAGYPLEDWRIMGQQTPTERAVAGRAYFSGLQDVLLGIWSSRKRRRRRLPYREQCQIAVELESGVYADQRSSFVLWLEISALEKLLDIVKRKEGVYGVCR